MPKTILRACPECGEKFAVTHPNKLFCSRPHAAAYNNRQLARGQALVSLGQAWRAARNRADPASKAAGREAFGELCRLIDRYSAEDRAAGRADPLRVYRTRQRLGLGR